MSVIERAAEAEARLSAHATQQERPKDYFRARPCGELDVQALVRDVKRRYPKILAHLAE